jgi:hypothetical protein
VRRQTSSRMAVSHHRMDRAASPTGSSACRQRSDAGARGATSARRSANWRTSTTICCETSVCRATMPCARRPGGSGKAGCSDNGSDQGFDNGEIFGVRAFEHHRLSYPSHSGTLRSNGHRASTRLSGLQTTACDLRHRAVGAWPLRLAHPRQNAISIFVCAWSPGGHAGRPGFEAERTRGGRLGLGRC